MEGFGRRCFAYAAPSIWNPLPTPVKRASSIDTFKSSPKTYLFDVAYPSIWLLYCYYCYIIIIIIVIIIIIIIIIIIVIIIIIISIIIIIIIIIIIKPLVIKWRR